MKKLLFAVFAFVMLFVANANNSYASVASYSINDEAVETLFDAGVQVVSMADDADFMGIAGMNNETAVKAGSKKPIVAFVLCWFLGYLGIHRAYMGTATGVIIGYILTLGGCGIVVTVDWIVLLLGAIDGDISKYENNKKFFMW